METILEPLVRSPRLLGYVEELNDLCRREADARRLFRESLDEDVRAEFINGEVTVQMTVRNSHLTTVRNLVRLLDLYTETRRLGVVLQEQALTGFTRNDYAPDICFWGTAKSTLFQPDTTVFPVPDFIAEVLSRSTASRDRGVKFEDYAAHGVGEYWIIDPDARTIEQYLLRQDRYELAGRFTDGVIRSAVIPGFEIPLLAAFDDQANLTALRQILA
jgi:Uma2 family endonuclease